MRDEYYRNRWEKYETTPVKEALVKFIKEKKPSTSLAVEIKYESLTGSLIEPAFARWIIEHASTI